MSLITILIVVLIVGAIAYGIKILPIDQLWKGLCYVILAIFVIIWLLNKLKAAGFDIAI